MKAILATCAAIALSAVFALPAPAVAAEQRADGVRNQDQIEVSSQRRYHRHGHRHYRHGHRHFRYGHRGYRYGYRPHYYAPYYAYRPYYSPGVRVGVGPFGFGFGF